MAVLVDRVLSTLEHIFRTYIQTSKQRHDGQWILLYQDLAGGLQSLDSIIKSFTGTLVVRFLKARVQGARLPRKLTAVHAGHLDFVFAQQRLRR